jgi:hypothetical protein
VRVRAAPGAPPWLCVQTPSNPGPLPNACPFAACRLGLEWAASSLLASLRLMRRCRVALVAFLSGSLGVLAEDGM